MSELIYGEFKDLMGQKGLDYLGELNLGGKLSLTH